MEDKEENYRKLVCKICKNKETCDLDRFRIYVRKDEISMSCPNYKYENSIL